MDLVPSFIYTYEINIKQHKTQINIIPNWCTLYNETNISGEKLIRTS